MFIDIFAGWPGHSHDAQVYHCSKIGQKIINDPESVLLLAWHIIGDGAYPLTESLMTPFKDNGHLTRKQKIFNKKLSSSRILIEQAFGKLIGRFSKLKYVYMYNIQRSILVKDNFNCDPNIQYQQKSTFWNPMKKKL
jgi:hypothetical protein